MHGVNDLNTLLLQKTYWGENPFRSETISKRFSIMGRIPLELRDNSEKKIEFNERYISSEYSANLKTFIAICRCRGIVPVLMTEQNRFTDIPSAVVNDYMRRTFGKGGEDSYALYRKTTELLAQSVRDVGSAEKVTVIDLATRIPKTSQHMYDMFHFNDEGSILASEIIAKELVQLL
jgi:lysophospholipase L1-like esterase